MITAVIYGHDVQKNHVVLVAPGQKVRVNFPMPLVVYALEFVNGYPAAPNLQAALNEAEDKLDSIREAGGWNEGIWDE